MSQQEFEDTLRRYLRREPFQPFVVELNNGGRIPVTHDRIAFGGGAATYLASAEPELEMVEFVCEDVRSIHPVERQAVEEQTIR